MISVCMATYNGEKFIESQLKSILSQLSEDDEVIISDDDSTDRTLEIVRRLSDKRIKIYHHETDHGFTRNFENALKYAKGDYIFLSDQDDEWLPDKVQTTIAALQEADFVVSDCITQDENGNVLDPSRFRTFKIKKGFWRLMIKTRYLGCCMAFRRNVLKAALPFPDNTYYMEHDLWLAAVAELYFNVRLLDKPLIIYKRHGDNASDAGQGKGYPLSIKIKRRIYRLRCLWKIRNKIKMIKENKYEGLICS